jgi:hypothetical protein
LDDNTIFGGDENPTHVHGAAKQNTTLCGVQFVTKEHWNLPHSAFLRRRVIVKTLDLQNLKMIALWEKL